MGLLERLRKRLKQAEEDVAESLPDEYDFEAAEIRDLLEDVERALAPKAA